MYIISECFHFSVYNIITLFIILIFVNRITLLRHCILLNGFSASNLLTISDRNVVKDSYSIMIYINGNPCFSQVNTLKT